jgi:hypothetical protein
MGGSLTTDETKAVVDLDGRRIIVRYGPVSGHR